MRTFFAARVICSTFLAATLWVAASAAVAQGRPARLTVIVVDTVSRPVPGVRVETNGANAATSDSSGLAVLDSVPAGNRLFFFKHPGFQAEHALLRVNDGADLRLRVTLTPAIETLDTLRVVAKRPVPHLVRNGFYRRQRQQLGSFLTHSEIVALADRWTDLSPALRRMRGFQVVPTSSGAFVIASSRSGGGTCIPAIYIDDLPGDLEILTQITPQEVEAIEGYSNWASAPGQYSANSACGVLLVWLRKD